MECQQPQIVVRDYPPIGDKGPAQKLPHRHEMGEDSLFRALDGVPDTPRRRKNDALSLQSD